MRVGSRVLFALTAVTAFFCTESIFANDRPIIIPLEPYVDEHWGFHAVIGETSQLVVFDTGGGLTAITPQAAAAAGCEPWGQLTGFRMRGDRLDLARCENVRIKLMGTDLTLPTVGVWDFNHLLPENAKPIAANVGLDVFAGHVVTLDIPHRRLILETQSSLKQRIAQSRPTAVHFIEEVEGYSQTVAVGLDTPKGRIWMHLDSGDDVPITVARHLAATMGLAPDNKSAQDLDVTLVGGTRLHGDAYVKDLIFDGNIGAPILSHWILTIDIPARRVWIATPHEDAPAAAHEQLR